jgi:hypothetical protein
MSDFFGRVTGDQDPIRKLVSYIPGFNGYIERSNRRAADKLLRDTVARRFEELYKRLSSIQADQISQGNIDYVDDLEKAALLMRTFTDKLRNATYGYSGLFDAVKINQEELTKIYIFDNAFFDLAEQIKNALDTVEASAVEGLPAAIRNLVALARQAITTYEKRYEIFNGAS